MSDSGKTSVSRIDLNRSIPYREENGAYSFGQKKAILLYILPLFNLHTFCNFPMDVDGNYTLIVINDTPFKIAYSVMNFTVNINGKLF